MADSDLARRKPENRSKVRTGCDRGCKSVPQAGALAWSSAYADTDVEFVIVYFGRFGQP